ncbi:MAG: 50S ribosomal protein L9, partial [Actinomycetota bacterium]|nr:50S ribosomal protein L9 [Actinomycetota bacterium]
MKVILTQEVKGKGGEGDVVDVAHGYAVNYLFPRKMAIEATSGNLKQLELRMHNIQQREDARISEASGLAGALEGKTVVVTAKVGEEGRLYGSITAQMIEEAIAEQFDTVVDRR